MKTELPPFVRWLISRIATGRDREIFEGDFEEALTTVKPHSWAYYLLIIKELSGIMRLSHLKRKSQKQPSGLGANMVKVIFRNLKRKWTYTLINVLGLSVSMMVFALILAYVTHELSYDRYHQDYQRTFRVTYQENADEPVDGHWARVPLDWINKLPDFFPQVEHFVRFQSFRFRDVQVENQTFREHHAFSVDPKVFEIFDLTFIHGDPRQALIQPNSVVLTEKTAKKYYGTADVMGKTITTTNDSGQMVRYQVTGVIDNIPDNSHLPINLLTSLNSNDERRGWAYIYVKLKDGKDASVIAGQMSKFIATHSPVAETTVMFNLQPIEDIHLKSHLAREISPNNHISYIAIFLAASGFLLIVAVINFANLNTVQALGRSREVGVRKVLGGSTVHLKRYFFLESLTLFLISLSIALLGYLGTFPYLEIFTGLSLQPDHLALLIISGVLVILVPWFSSLYPSYNLVGLSVTTALKSQLQTNQKLPARKILIGLQFGLAMALISAMLITQKQFQFLQSKNLGFQDEQVLAIRHIPGEAKQQLALIQQEFTRLPAIDAVSAVMELPGSAVRDGIELLKPGQEADQGVTLDIQVIEPSFTDLMQMNLVAGNMFRDAPYSSALDNPNDIIATIESRKRSYLINESAARLLGWNDPKDAIGQLVRANNPFYQLAEGPIIGVLEDFHQESLRATIDPVVLIYEPIWLSHLLIKVNGSQLFETIDQIETQWRAKYPGYPMDLVFLDQELNRLYAGERMQKDLLQAFTAITLLVATLGLLGLMGYSLKIRQKELAVRKVLGADLISLIRLLVREYAWSLLIGIGIAIPVVWIAMDRWLSNYAYHANIHLSSFVLSGVLLALLIAFPLVTQIIRNDRNPADVLKRE